MLDKADCVNDYVLTSLIFRRLRRSLLDVPTSAENPYIPGWTRGVLEPCYACYLMCLLNAPKRPCLSRTTREELPLCIPKLRARQFEFQVCSTRARNHRSL